MYNKISIFYKMLHLYTSKYFMGQINHIKISIYERKIRKLYMFKIGCNQCSYCCCLFAVMYDSFATPWTLAYQALLSMGFSRQEYWNGLPFPSSGGSSWPRDWTCVFYIDRWVFVCLFVCLFYHWAIGEAQPMQCLDINAQPWRKRWNVNRMLQGKDGRLNSLIMFLPEKYDDNKTLIVYVNLHLQKGQETRFGG